VNLRPISPKPHAGIGKALCHRCGDYSDLATMFVNPAGPQWHSYYCAACAEKCERGQGCAGWQR